MSNLHKNEYQNETIIEKGNDKRADADLKDYREKSNSK